MNKAKTLSDETYFAFRDYVNSTANFNVFEYVEHFPLYAGVHTMARYFLLFEKLKETNHLAGDIIEFGVWKGATSLFLAKMLNLMQPNTAKRVVLFDNFSGLPERGSKDVVASKEVSGNYKGDYENLTDILRRSDLESLVDINIGDASETIVEYENKNPHRCISFALLDFDLYEPTKIALEFIDRKLVPGGIVALDEGYSDLWPGEGTALQEMLSTTKSRWQVLTNQLTRQPEVFIQKIA